MRLKSLVLVITAAAVAAWLSDLYAAPRIEWHPYEAGMARSRFEKKKAFIYFYADWCGYCAEMDRKTFTDPEVVALLNRSFIPIRVDADRDKAAASLFRVKGLPDIWFMGETGEAIGHRPGYIPSDQMLKVLNSVLSAPPK
jgi:thiol:disulfide interchange protein DsbD